MNRQTAIKSIVGTLAKDDILVSTTGLISREVFERYDDDRCFYVTGSMGLVSSIGLGLTLSQLKRIVVIDGDSSLLMNLGTLVTCGKWQRCNLTHIVIDNNAYGSCSEERSMSENANFTQLAKSVGYQKVFYVSDGKNLKNAIMESDGSLSFIQAIIKLGGRRDFARPLELPIIKDRFMSFMKGDGENDV